ncbi:hypothetical protein [Micromonospora avicenniae]|uniref:Uncharacterized protein n=1 Tax=Micromonospora avicenniae TaxID=1198245 RepID=A0A1N7D0G5_9ACTN|nr:hypothetical protein [Micromonospora avicenniae]SIR69280.1 hypothetical protein SAMN05444858_114147 [Micromonospora avicenniae]
MAKHRHVSGDDPLNLEEAAETPAYWSVDDSRWPAIRPDLPRDVADLLAPPIVVGVARVAATSRLTPPGAAPTRTRRTTPGAVPAPAVLAPSTTAPTTRRTVPASAVRPAGVPDPVGTPAGGRHRRTAAERRF